MPPVCNNHPLYLSLVGRLGPLGNIGTSRVGGACNTIAGCTTRVTLLHHLLAVRLLLLRRRVERRHRHSKLSQQVPRHRHRKANSTIRRILSVCWTREVT